MEMRQRPDDGFFKAVHVFLDKIACTAEINQRIGDHLSRAMVGDLPTTIRCHHRDIARCNHMMLRQLNLA